MCKLSWKSFIILFLLLVSLQVEAFSVNLVQADGSSSISEFNTDFFYRSLTSENVEAFDFIDPQTQKSIHRIQLVRDGSLPIAIRLNHKKEFSLQRFYQELNLQHEGLMQLDFETRMQASYPTVENTVQELLSFLEKEVPRTPLKFKPGKRQGSTIRLEWSYKGIAIALDFISSSLALASCFTPIPVIPEIIVVGFISKPLAKKSQEFYDRANYIRGINYTDYHAKRFKPISLRIIDFVHTIPGHIKNGLQSGNRFLRNTAAGIYSRMRCRGNFAF